MKLYTDVTTLSKLYPLFEVAGIEGMLTGDFEEFQGITLSKLAGRFLAAGQLPEICEIITRSEVYIPDPNDLESDPNCQENGLNDFDNDLNLTPKPWCECSLEECLGVVLPFFIDITVGPIDLAKALETMEKERAETSL